MDFKELPQKIETEIFKLHKKRYRKETYKYIIEGIICINELLNAGIEPFYVVCSDEFINSEKSVDILSKLKKIKVPSYLYYFY